MKQTHIEYMKEWYIWRDKIEKENQEYLKNKN